MDSRDTLTKKKNDFLRYVKSKDITQAMYRKFSSDLTSHVSKNKEDASHFFDFIQKVKSRDFGTAISDLNELLDKSLPGYETASYVCDWVYLYMGPGEMIALVISDSAKSGRKTLPDILFDDSGKKIEVKSYNGGFRLTESTSFFTDLGTIIQALVQGGFLNSLTEINNNDLRKSLRHFGESFLSKRGFIELQGKIWKMESKTDEQIVFVASPETPAEIAKYSIVRNSMRNWLGRGTLSISLSQIIDPNRKTRILKREIQTYIKNLIGADDLTPIPLEQYFHLCSLDGILVYDKNEKDRFKIYLEKDLSWFKLERLSQAKVTYTKKK